MSLSPAKPDPPVKKSKTYQFAAALALVFALGCAVGYLAGDHGFQGETGVTQKSRLDAAAASTAGEGGMQSAFAPAGYALPDDRAASSEMGLRIIAALRARDYFQRRYEIYALGQKLDASNIREAMEATQSLNSTDRDNSQYVLLARWLELDADAAFRWVKDQPAKNRKPELMREFFHSLGLKDPASALSFLSRNKADNPSGSDYSYSVFEAWSSHDPVAASDAAFALADKSAKSSALNITLARWAKRDPQTVMQRIASLPDESARETYRGVVLRAWAEDDPEAALAHAETLPEGAERQGALAMALRGAATKDLASAAKYIDRLPAGAVRAQTLSSIVNENGYKDPAGAALFALALPPAQQRNSVYQIVNGLSRDDPMAALEFAGKLVSAEARASATRSAMQSWASKDPKAAAEYCAKDETGRPDDIRSVVSTWASKDTAEAFAWAQALPSGPKRDAAIGGALVGMAKDDPERAIKTATTMLSPEQQNRVLSPIAGQWAAKDPKAAAKWASELKTSQGSWSIAYSVTSAWARKDPQAAADWIMQSPTAGFAVSNVTQEWANVDPTAAAKWLDRVPAGKNRDSAIQGFIQAVTDTDPAGAAEWAQTISDANQRENAVSNLYRKWNSADPKASEAWLRSATGISDQTRERILKSSAGSQAIYY